jgi:hypothetical protein
MELLASLAAEERWLFPAFLVMYAAIYCVGQLFVFRRWALRQRLDGSSCLISLFHGTPAALAAAGTILALPAGFRSFAAPNARLQDHVLDYSIAYFTMDLLHYLAFLPADVLFIAHHLATLFVFLTCRYMVRHGALSTSYRGGCGSLGLLLSAQPLLSATCGFGTSGRSSSGNGTKLQKKQRKTHNRPSHSSHEMVYQPCSS